MCMMTPAAGVFYFSLCVLCSVCSRLTIVFMTCCGLPLLVLVFGVGTDGLGAGMSGVRRVGSVNFLRMS